MGGLGGFFPPLALGIIRQQTGSFLWGFVLLAVFAVLCLAVAKMTARRQLGLQGLKAT
jgi:NNP family nitrate/nitrite transporter-like MFS transporter